MKKLLLISTAALLISGAPAALAQNGVNPSAPRHSSTGAGKTTVGMARTHTKGSQAGSQVNAFGKSNAPVINPQDSTEGRTSGGGGGGGGM